ncbi:hypothetical protein M9Y10_016071 [Tritrichomonas musculus]|uniref:Surface antigen BspA-like n=1 Tax=Tritrichomonas musculus TaxID=1915356 RepID=A0ABR2I6F4_9EUKA
MDLIEDSDAINYDFLQSVDVIFQLWIKKPEEFEQKLSDIINRLQMGLKHLDQQNVSSEIISYIFYLCDEMSDYHVNIIDYRDANEEISEIDDNIGNTAEELSFWLDNYLYSRRSKIMIENHNYNNIKQDCLIYSINEIQKTAEVVGCIFEKTTIIIPSKINHESHEYTVIGIYKKAFKKTQYIKTIQFPVDSKLLTIGERAFYRSQIECFSIPVNLQEIHEEAFFYCEKLHEINIPINSKLQLIGRNAFVSCSLECINIPSSLIKIDKRAFYFCYQLKHVHIENDSNLQIIEKEAFAYSSIESISISANLKELKEGCFKETPKLNKINVSPNNQFYIIYDNNFILSKSSPTKEYYDTLVFSIRDIESVIIPDFIEIIAKYAFNECKKLKNIEILINSKLQIIENNAFSSSSIEKIILPYHLKKVCRHAFAFCKKLQNVEIHPNSQLLIIEREAFHHSNIEIISFPTSPLELQEGWCIQTQKLAKINITQNNNNYMIYDNKFVLGKSSPEKEKYDVLILAFRDITEAIIPDFIEVIGSYAFEGCSKLMNVEISSYSQLKEIRAGAFSASAIESIKIPPNLIRIYEDAFYSCTKLHTVDIPKDSKLMFIGARAFYKASIKSIYIPDNLTEINEYTFLNCKNLQTVEFGINSKLTFIKKYAFTCACIENIKIPPSVIRICDASFYYCKKLTHVEIPKESNLQIIDNLAFSQTRIKTIIPTHVKKIGCGAFSECESPQIDFSPDSELQTICIDAFYGLQIESLTIPSSFTDFQEGWCSILPKLTKINMQNNKNYTLYQDKFILGKSSLEKEDFDDKY